MKHLLRSFPLYPFLFACFPILSLYTGNLLETSFGSTLRSFGLSLVGVGLVLLLLLWLIARSLHRAGLAAGLLSVAFFTFGSAYTTIRDRLPSGSLLGMANVQFALWAAVLIIVVWLILRKLPEPRPLTVILNVVGLSLVITAMAPLPGYLLRQARAEVRYKHPANLDLQPGPGWNGERPDIYYIILDGYGRTDAMQEIHHVDNGEFIAFLQQRGFTVATQSQTNYARTMLSLSSSLNYNYLDSLATVRDEQGIYDLTMHLMDASAVQAFLKARGYTTVALASGYEVTEIRGADHYISQSRGLNIFEETLLPKTMAIFWLDKVTGDFHRQEIRQSFSDLAAAARIPGPKFVFAHLPAPHPPFVFDENGGPVDPRGGGDGNTYPGGVEQYLTAYRRQMLYTSRLTEEAITAILRDSPTPPVIIVQGDHGPGALVDWWFPENTCYRERLPILNALALPGKDPSVIPADLSPVNTFRLVFNQYFNTDLPFESNRSYTVLYENKYTYIDVTDMVGKCPGK